MWRYLAQSEGQNASRAARWLILAIFVGLAWLVTSIASNRRHPHRRVIAAVAWALILGIIGYILTFRPVERWSIWAVAAFGYGVLMIWACGGGSAPKAE